MRASLVSYGFIMLCACSGQLLIHEIKWRECESRDQGTYALWFSVGYGLSQAHVYHWALFS